MDIRTHIITDTNAFIDTLIYVNIISYNNMTLKIKNYNIDKLLEAFYNKPLVIN